MKFKIFKIFHMNPERRENAQWEGEEPTSLATDLVDQGLVRKGTHLLDLGCGLKLKPFTPVGKGAGEMFCVLPNGKISTCSRVTKDDDLLANTFIVGKVFDQKVEIDASKIESLRHLNVMFYDQCKDCFAKWYCMGGCHNTRLLNLE
jgi:radical SAM protein with 4Fe4S-binding SPASM domain